MAEGWTPAADRLFNPDHELAGDVVCRRFAWLDLCHQASWKGNTRVIGTSVVPLERGEFVASLRWLGHRWRWSPNKVARYLMLLRSKNVTKIVPVRETPKGTVYRIVKYEVWRKRLGLDGTQSGAATRQRRNSGGTDTEQSKDGKYGNKLTNTGTNYVGRAIDLWRKHQGEPTAGKLGKALKPLVQRHGEVSVLRHLEVFAQSTDARFGFFHFAEHFNDFDPDAPAFPGYPKV
jgi:hypothetical protein